MRLYPLNAPRAVIDHPQWGNFEASEDHGGFDLPDEMSDEMHSFHHRGKRIWETEDERSERLHGDETARRRDPETLYNAVAEIANVTKQLAGLKLGEAAAVPAEKAPAKAAAGK